MTQLQSALPREIWTLIRKSLKKTGLHDGRPVKIEAMLGGFARYRPEKLEACFTLVELRETRDGHKAIGFTVLVHGHSYNLFLTHQEVVRICQSASSDFTPSLLSFQIKPKVPAAATTSA